MTAPGAAGSPAAEVTGRGNQAAAVAQPLPAAITKSDDGYVVEAEVVA